MDVIGIEERLKHKDITWLMPSVDVEDILHRLNSRIARKRGNEITAFCPDHHLFTGREPSHPKWTVNVETGKTYCFTEGRGSNLVWIVCRLLDCPPREAVKFLTGIETDAEFSALRMASVKRRIAGIRRKEEEGEEREPVRLDEIGMGLKKRFTSKRLYDFFIHPPEKPNPTNILPETVDRYRVFEMTWGFYADRAIVPFFSKGELVGHCAIDLLGEEKWRRTYPLEDEYRKVRYPANFPSSEYLFGLEDCGKNPELIIVVEGPREVMKLWQEGYKAAAVLGSRVHSPQIRLLARLNPGKIALMFDGDAAGYDATDRESDSLSRLFSVIPCYLPIGKDPKNLDGGEVKKILEKSEKSS